MKAWQLTAANEPLRLIEREDPQPGPGQVVAMWVSLDGTLTGMLPKLPMVLGHEVAGVVTELGPEVSGVEVGDRVVILGPAQHAPGWSADGGFANKVLAMAEGLTMLPDTVDFVQGATATDAGQTAYGAVMSTGKVREGEHVGIVGLGLTGARIAVVAGARVYAAEPNLEVWPLAAERGVAELVEDVRELASFDLDVIFDFAGFGTTTAGAISTVHPGGRVVVVGLGRNEATISTAELVYKSVTLRGSRGGQPGALESVLDLMAAGELTINTTTIGFEEIPTRSSD